MVHNKLSKLFIVSLFFMIFSGQVFGQDQRYSQYYSSPSRLNPALAGVFNGTYRFGINYRTQWGENMYKAFNSGSFTADARFRVLDKDYIGVGINAMYDKAGISGYSIMEIGIDFNYQKKLYQGRGILGKNQQQYIVAGGRIAIGQRAVNWDNLTFSTQWDPEAQGYYNLNINNGEPAYAIRQNRLYPEISAGAMWYGTFGERRSAFFGASIYHLNSPDISLFSAPLRDTATNITSIPVERLPLRFTIHGGGEVLLGNGRAGAFSLLPGFVAMFQGPSAEINFGLLCKYQQPKFDDFAFKFGLWGRVVNQYINFENATMGFDALVAHIGLDYNNFQLGLSYDVTLSKLSLVNNSRGSFEVSLFYILLGKDSRRQGCPSFK